MAHSLMRQAAKQLQRANDFRKRTLATKKAETQQALGGASALLGAVGAALIDKKFGEGGEQAKVADFLPINAAAGVGFAGAALAIPKLPFRLPIGMLGLGMACASAYRFTFDNVTFEEK